MPCTHQPPRPAPSDNRIRYLCSEQFRRRNPNMLEFLSSIHDAYHQRGSLTELQLAALGRVIAVDARRNGPPNDMDGELEISERRTDIVEDGETGRRYVNRDDEQESTETRAASGPTVPAARTVDTRPAERGDPCLVNNGEWAVIVGDNLVYVRIHTITHSVRTPALVGKRVVETRMSTHDRWSTLGYLTRGGTLKLWRSQEHRASDRDVMHARRLLTALVENAQAVRGHSHHTLHADDLSGRWSFETMGRAMCAVCDHTLHTYEAVTLHPMRHQSCAASAANRSRPRVVETNDDEFTPQTPVVEMSELGTGWER